MLLSRKNYSSDIFHQIPTRQTGWAGCLPQPRHYCASTLNAQSGSAAVTNVKDPDSKLVGEWAILTKGTYINDVRRFSTIFDPPFPPNPILSHFSSCPYYMTSYFDPQTPPPLLIYIMIFLF